MRARIKSPIGRGLEYLVAGAGYAVGEEDDDINELAELLGAELIVTSTSSDSVAVYRRGEQLILVGDANGPWAVSVD